MDLPAKGAWATLVRRPDALRNPGKGLSLNPGFRHRPEPKWHFFALSQAIFALRALTPAQIQLILNIKVYLGVEQTQRSTK